MAAGGARTGGFKSAKGSLAATAKTWNSTGGQDVLGNASTKRLWDTQNRAFEGAMKESTAWLERAEQEFGIIEQRAADDDLAARAQAMRRGAAEGACGISASDRGRIMIAITMLPAPPGAPTAEMIKDPELVGFGTLAVILSSGVSPKDVVDFSAVRRADDPATRRLFGADTAPTHEAVDAADRHSTFVINSFGTDVGSSGKHVMTLAKRVFNLQPPRGGGNNPETDAGHDPPPTPEEGNIKILREAGCTHTGMIFGDLGGVMPFMRSVVEALQPEWYIVGAASEDEYDMVKTLRNQAERNTYKEVYQTRMTTRKTLMRKVALALAFRLVAGDEATHDPRATAAAARCSSLP